jgi:heme/copper-type cytochrome/quinol oxidase subunit 3
LIIENLSDIIFLRSFLLLIVETLSWTRFDIKVISISIESIGYPVVILNTCLLFWSSICVIIFILRSHTLYGGLGLGLGALFLTIQWTELSLPNAINSSILFSGIILGIQLHGSHMLLGCLLFGVIMCTNFIVYMYDVSLEFVVTYWHLIEFVWCVLLCVGLVY